MGHPPPPPRKCSQCKAGALKQANEPDGLPRCFGHSLDPLIIAKRGALGEKGRAAGEKQRGVPPEQRGAVMAGVVSLDKARADAIGARTAKAKAEEPEAEAIELNSRDKILAALGKTMGRLSKHQLDAQEANAAASLCRAALAALGAELPTETEDQDEAPRGFEYTTTTGKALALRGRGDG